MSGNQLEGRRGETVALQVEECCYRYLMVGGGMVLVGLALMLTTVLFWLGAPMVAVGGAIIVGNIVWFLRVKKQQGINVTCPHCNKEYNILPGSHSFMCDECQQVVPVPRAA